MFRDALKVLCKSHLFCSEALCYFSEYIWIFTKLFSSAIFPINFQDEQIRRMPSRRWFYLVQLYIALFLRKLRIMPFPLIYILACVLIKMKLKVLFEFLLIFIVKKLQKTKVQKKQGSSQTVPYCVTMHAHQPIKLSIICHLYYKVI